MSGSGAPSSTAATRRRKRESDILRATRELFDARGVRDAQIEDIARAVGVNRAIIYRHFSGKEELFALTVVGYLDELAGAMAAADDPGATPPARLEALSGAFLDYGARYPAFVDCALALLRRPGDELLREVSEAAVFRLGRAIGACLTQLVAVLRAGDAAGDFRVDDPDLLANVLYTQALGGLQLARAGLTVREVAPGIPALAPVSFDQVKAYLVDASLAMAAGRVSARGSR